MARPLLFKKCVWCRSAVHAGGRWMTWAIAWIVEVVVGFVENLGDLVGRFPAFGVNRSRFVVGNYVTWAHRVFSHHPFAGQDLGRRGKSPKQRERAQTRHDNTPHSHILPLILRFQHSTPELGSWQGPSPVSTTPSALSLDS